MQTFCPCLLPADVMGCSAKLLRHAGCSYPLAALTTQGWQAWQARHRSWRTTVLCGGVRL